MNNKTPHPSPNQKNTLDLTQAVEQFVARGGVIDVITDGDGSPPRPVPLADKSPGDTQEQERKNKVEHLRELVAKGAGMSALQYSLRMNKKEIKQLASEHGIKIAFSRPVSEIKREALQDPI